MADLRELLIKVESLKNMMVAYATGEQTSEADYRQLRDDLIAEPLLKNRLPPCVLTNRTLGEFWGDMKSKFAHYRERRAFLRDEFDPVLTFLEQGVVSPVEDHGMEVLAKIDLPHIHDAWKKMLDRAKGDDVDGAITAARTLVETVCKHILDDLGTGHPDDADLPTLYKLVSKSLNLAPSQHTEQVFKQILGGCTAAVEGLGAVRNRFSDAHGSGKEAVKAQPRHAELAVNLAGTVTTFLVDTWEARKAEEGESATD